MYKGVQRLVFKGRQAEAGGTGGWSAKAYNASPQEEENHATLSGWLAGAANTCGRIRRSVPIHVTRRGERGWTCTPWLSGGDR